MNNDHENTVKAMQCAALLRGDLQDMAKSEDMMLSDCAMDLIELAAKIESKLARIEYAINPKWRAAK